MKKTDYSKLPKSWAVISDESDAFYKLVFDYLKPKLKFGREVMSEGMRIGIKKDGGFDYYNSLGDNHFDKIYSVDEFMELILVKEENPLEKIAELEDFKAKQDQAFEDFKKQLLVENDPCGKWWKSEGVLWFCKELDKTRLKHGPYYLGYGAHIYGNIEWVSCYNDDGTIDEKQCSKHIEDSRLATKKEVEDILKKVADKLGFKIGEVIGNCVNEYEGEIFYHPLFHLEDNIFKLSECVKTMGGNRSLNDNWIIFSEGKWAKIKETFKIGEFEVKFFSNHIEIGCKIISLKQIQNIREFMCGGLGTSNFKSIQIEDNEITLDQINQIYKKLNK